METFDIEFGGHIMARIVIENDKPKVIACINGYGESIPIEDIIIKKVTL